MIPSVGATVADEEVLLREDEGVEVTLVDEEAAPLNKLDELLELRGLELDEVTLELLATAEEVVELGGREELELLVVELELLATAEEVVELGGREELELLVIELELLLTREELDFTLEVDGFELVEDDFKLEKLVDFELLVENFEVELLGGFVLLLEIWTDELVDFAEVVVVCTELLDLIEELDVVGLVLELELELVVVDEDEGTVVIGWEVLVEEVEATEDIEDMTTGLTVAVVPV